MNDQKTEMTRKKKRTLLFGSAPRFPFTILKEIEPHDIIRKYEVIQHDQNIYKKDLTLRIVYISIGLFIWMICLFIVFFEGWEIFKLNKKELDSVVFCLFVYIVPTSLIFYGLLIPNKTIILNREEGSITIPRSFWRKHITFPFSEGEAVITSVKTGGVTHRIEVWHNGVRSRGGVLYTSATSGTLQEVEDYWSFAVWYMDKNRPLPPGKIFDPYRVADFERRRVEGFPYPLYRSNIPTLEATPEQQKQRDKVWPKRLM